MWAESAAQNESRQIRSSDFSHLRPLLQSGGQEMQAGGGRGRILFHSDVSLYIEASIYIHNLFWTHKASHTFFFFFQEHNCYT